jgi:hypothetical protein
LALVMPWRVSGCEIVTCSGYVPGQTSTVEDGGTLATAVEMFSKDGSVGLQVPTA